MLAVWGSIGLCLFFFFQAEDGIRDLTVTGVQTCALPISCGCRHVIYGDASRTEVLEAAGVDTAVALILSASATEQTSEIIRIARKTNPELRVIARANYLREAEAMRKSGAEAVFAGEGEVALAMTEHILGIMGATAEQMDRERQRVREEVFPKTAPLE